MFMHGDISGFIIAMFVIFVLVKLSNRASGYNRRQGRNNSNRYGWRGGMFGPGFWYGNFGPRSFGNRFSNNPNNDPNDLNNPNNPYFGSNQPNNGANNTPPSNAYNPYDRQNTYYAPPGNFYQPPTSTSTPPNSSFNWPQATQNVTTGVNSAEPNASNSVHGWEMPANQVVLKEAFVWVRSIAGWHYAGKLIVDGGLSSNEVKQYAQGKFAASGDDLICIEAASFEDAKRTFEGYHFH